MKEVNDMGKRITVNFKAAPNDNATNCTLNIDWSSIENNIDNLCVLICDENLGDSVFSFLSLSVLEDIISLPKIRINLKLGPFTIYVYGLERTQRRAPYFYKVCASDKKTLKYTAGKNNNWQLDLQPHSIGPSSMTSHKDIVGEQPFTMKKKKVSRCVRLTTEDMDLPVDVLMVLKEQDESNELFWLTGALNKSLMKIPFDLLATGLSKVKVYTLQKVFCKTGLMIYKKTKSSIEVDINRPQSSQAPTKLTDMTSQQLETLMNKATNYISQKPKMYQLSTLYRNKPPFYFHSILQLHDGMMETYRKDYNGDSASCINGAIDGLFFSTGLNLRTNKPPCFSYFGAKRLKIPPESIINNDCNMYFADFYCHYEAHYVTVVVTKTGSQTDDFCAKKLIRLDPTSNAFICTSQFQSFSVTMSVFVEIFYTEDIDIKSLCNSNQAVSLSRVKIRGRGESKKYGIPKKKNCDICQL